jgi:2-amino-4-hydroxy-6-hydroxymethyldihydropteridine diphosphokinase / dihydropteroate synthase
MVILGLGSNTGDRLAHLSAAVRELSGLLSDMRLSRVLEAEALLKPGAPESWNQPFLNMAVAGNTALSPQALFMQVKEIEQRIGRVARGVWAPREIDIDILAMDGLVLETPDLTIPHRELLNRDFALLPLTELAPDWHYPIGPCQGKRAADIAREKDFALSACLKDTGMTIRAAA